LWIAPHTLNTPNSSFLRVNIRPASQGSLDFYTTGRYIFVPCSQQPAMTTFPEPVEPSK